MVWALDELRKTMKTEESLIKNLLERLLVQRAKQQGVNTHIVSRAQCTCVYCRISTTQNRIACYKSYLARLDRLRGYLKWQNRRRADGDWIK